MRQDAAKKIGGTVYYTDDEIYKIRKNNSIVQSAIHPDTNELIPFYMRLSGFAVLKTPIIVGLLFVRN